MCEVFIAVFGVLTAANIAGVIILERGRRRLEEQHRDLMVRFQSIHEVTRAVQRR